MKVEIEITDADEYALIALLMAYRTSPKAPQGTPFVREWNFENRLAATCIKDILRLLERRQTPVLDCAVIDTVAILEQKAAVDAR